MTKILLLFSFILVAMSCTVTKRVHRPGYHVVWHKQQREVQPHELSDEIGFEHQSKQKEKTENSQVIKAIEDENSSSQAAPVIAQPVSDEVNMGDRSSINFIEPIQQNDTENSIESAPLQSNEKLQSNRSIRPIFWRIPPDTLILLGTILMIIGGLILLGVLFEFLGAFSGNGDGGWLNFFLNLFDASGWFWLLIFLIVIIFVLFLLHLLIRFVLGGPMIALFIGLGLLAFGLFLFLLGQKRTE